MHPRADRHSLIRVVWLLVAAMHGLATAADDYVWKLPAGFPPPHVPADNPMSEQKVALGAQLFEDPRLSVTGTYSCASCHDPARYFTDGQPRAIGATGEVLQHNTPTLLNAAYNASFGWMDQDLDELEDQHLIPLTNNRPVEMGFDDDALARLNADAGTRRQFSEVFGSDEVTLTLVVRAIAAYVRTLVSGDGPLDALILNDDRGPLGAVAVAGVALFTSERLGCSGCHAGFTLSGPIRHATGGFAPSFHRTGVGDGAGEFRAPTLRHIRHTGPYMHDGSLGSLDAVIDFYARGGGVGAVALHPFTLTAKERGELLAFLESL